VAAGAFVTGTAQAQTCLGYSSLASGRMNISGAAHFFDGATSYSAQVNMGVMGHGHSHLVSLFAQENTYDDITVGGVTVRTDNNLTFGGGLGVQVRSSRGLEWCPQVGVDYMTGDSRVLGLQGVLGMGRALAPMGAVSLVPYLWGGVRYQKPDCDNCGDETSAVYGAGLGFRLTAGQQATPSISRTSQAGAKTVFHVALTFPIGKGT